MAISRMGGSPFLKVVECKPPPVAYRAAGTLTRHQHLMSEFALILAAKGHAVDYQTLERLADVAIGDV